MKINIDELSEALTSLLSELKNNLGNEIEIKSDYYWDISSEQLYDPYNEPTGMTIGQLSDDIYEISRIISSKEGIPYDIKRIAEVLKAISIEYPLGFWINE